MKNVSFRVLLLFVQIFLASKLVAGEGSHVGDLVQTKSGKVFLRRSSKKEILSKKDTEDVGHYYSNDGQSKVTQFSSRLIFLFEHFQFLSTL